MNRSVPGFLVDIFEAKAIAPGQGTILELYRSAGHGIYFRTSICAPLLPSFRQLKGFHETVPDLVKKPRNYRHFANVAEIIRNSTDVAPAKPTIDAILRMQAHSNALPTGYFFAPAGNDK
jgi:hypothetical protein